jgi:hypothetical protein
VFTVYENEDEEYITFRTGMLKAIDSYLEFRQRHGERIKEDAPLIRESFDTKDEIHAGSDETGEMLCQGDERCDTGTDTT